MAYFPTKESALAWFEEHCSDWLQVARAWAMWLGWTKRLVTSDDVWDVCPVPEGMEPRVMGGVFREPPGVWRRTGRSIPSRRSCRHEGPCAEWEYLGGPVEPPEVFMPRFEREREEALAREARARARRRERLEARA